MIVVNAARDYCGPSHGFQLDGVAFRDVLDQLRRGVGIVAVGAAGVGNDRGVELLAEFSAQFGDSPLRLFRDFLRGGAVLNGVDRLPRVILEVAQQAFQLLLHLLYFGLLVSFALGDRRRDLSTF